MKSVFFKRFKDKLRKQIRETKIYYLTFEKTYDVLINEFLLLFVFIFFKQ